MLGTISIISIELFSSYFLYRHFAKIEKSFQPAGFAVHDLLARILNKHLVMLKADHGPVFDLDDTLGYIMYPGHYRISEHNAARSHVFHLTANEKGERATSYAPVHASRRIFLTGDSAMFGWGVDDEDTVAWLLQTRLPDYEVVNLSLTSYSTVHALLQLQRMVPPLTSGDIVVLVYHPMTNDFNVAAKLILEPMLDGFEMQLGDKSRMREMKFPYGAIDPQGAFTTRRISLSCVNDKVRAECVHPEISRAEAQRVTARVIDQIVALHKGPIVLAVISSEPNDAVIAHARARGLTIADFRAVQGDTEDDDIIATDGHPGPFWHHLAFLVLLETLQRNHLID
jgi:hypothetical protein